MMIINHKTYHNDILLFVKSINIVSKAQILCQSLRLHHQMVRYCVVVPSILSQNIYLNFGQVHYEIWGSVEYIITK